MKEINNNIQESYCSFEVAKLLKEKGFDVPIPTAYVIMKKWQMDDPVWSKYAVTKKGHALYRRQNSFGCIMSHSSTWKNSEWVNESICAPTHSLAIEWIETNFNIFITITTEGIGSDEWAYKYVIKWLPIEFENEKRRVVHYKEYDSLYIGGSSYSGGFNTRKETTEAALLYVLKNLIK